jgi:hypothetical protein
LAPQILHPRRPAPQKKKRRIERLRKSRESRLWSQAVAALGRGPAGQQWVDGADRGADIVEFLATEDDWGRAGLVRAAQNRRIWVGHAVADGAAPADPPDKLFPYLRGLPAEPGQRRKQIYDAELLGPPSMGF